MQQGTAASPPGTRRLLTSKNCPSAKRPHLPSQNFCTPNSHRFWRLPPRTASYLPAHTLSSYQMPDPTRKPSTGLLNCGILFFAFYFGAGGSFRVAEFSPGAKPISRPFAPIKKDTDTITARGPTPSGATSVRPKFWHQQQPCTRSAKPYQTPAPSRNLPSTGSPKAPSNSLPKTTSPQPTRAKAPFLQPDTRPFTLHIHFFK